MGALLTGEAAASPSRGFELHPLKLLIKPDPQALHVVSLPSLSSHSSIKLVFLFNLITVEKVSCYFRLPCLQDNVTISCSPS